jgi:alkylation response protein AidB-like acyl-CoA dehydrogenase
MFSFDLSDEQRMMVEAVRRYAQEHSRKHFRDADERGELPPGLLQTGWELGLTAGNIPESWGGFGPHSALNGVLCAEELGWGDLAAALALLTPNLVAFPILECGTKAQKQRFLPRFCSDRFLPAAAALIEPSIRFDPKALETRATPLGDGYVLNGRKAFVPLAREAETLLVYASEDGATQAFLVEPATPGLSLGEREKNMGIKALATYELRLGGVKVGGEAKLGGKAGIRFERLLDHSRVALAALAVGVARGAYEYALEYAKNRQAFGEPIASRQAIAFRLAEMAIDIDAARLMVWEAAWKLDRGEDATREAHLAKDFTDRMVLEVTDGAVQILGGHGYIRDYPVELWLRNGRGFTHFDGLAMV